ncbi:MAG: FtsK/SpoIIIE domain-containing protein [Ilumatobacteraceae bacterium]
MDLIVSTPQGEAEISVNAVHESVTVGDLLGRVLNSAPPNLVYIDGRPTPAGTIITAAGLVTGSLIEINAPLERLGDGVVTLVQAAGEGGGNRRPLAPGRYLLGTARRANVSPLTFNQVLVPRCEIVVEHNRVTVAANQGDLDGHPATNPARWDDQRLRIGHRVFRLDGEIEDRAASLLPTPLGQLNFVRGPRDEPAAEPEPNGRTRTGGRRLRNRRSNRVEVEPPAPLVADPSRQAFESDLENIRRTHLDLAEVVRRATKLSQHLWERRPIDDDAFVFSIGLADQRWNPEEGGPVDRRDLAVLPSTPVLVDLVNQRGIGFAGTPPQARAAARALVIQACVAHSPADLDVVVLATPAGAARWEWIKWLPHARASQGVQLMSDDETITDWINAQRTLTTVVASIQSLGRPITPSRLTLAVVDDPALWRGRAATLRGLFAEAQLPVRFVAITDRADDVPAVCTTVVRIEANGSAEVDYPISGPTITDVVPFVLEHEVAVAAARKLSPLEDHTVQPSATAVLPPVVSLASLVDPDGPDAGRIADRWAASRKSRRLRVAVGTGESGCVELDLPDDGPHGLIVGAPRTGKTDLLRTIVASIVATTDPSAVNIICIEPSEGSSFGTFVDVEHVVGYVKSFDEHAGGRLLRALQSEINRRARVLAEHHAVSLADYQQSERHVQERHPDESVSDQQAAAIEDRLDDPHPIPRLVILVDDADAVLLRHAAFLPQLIELADRSRHLGIHLIIATSQMPRSIEHTLKSFANIRIALRMSDPTEAVALMGSRDPIQVSLHTPGRGAIRLGDGTPAPVQFASAVAAAGDLMEITPFILARDLNAAERKVTNRMPDPAAEPHRKGALRPLVEAVSEAASRQPRHDRQPILCADLPTELAYEQIWSLRASTADDDGAAFALSDLPDDHTQNARRWNPVHDGNLLVIGGSTTERSNALATLFVAATDRMPPDRLHGYVIDCATGPLNRLKALEALPACGAVASSEDPDRILRVLVHIVGELEHRSSRDHSSNAAHIVLVVNDIGPLLRSLELGGEFEGGRELLERVISSGPLHGITTLMSSASEHAAPARMLGQFQQRIILHLDERGAYRALGIEPGRIPVQVPGRAITLPDLVEIQIGSIGDLVEAVAVREGRFDASNGPTIIPRTPDAVPLEEYEHVTEYSDDQWHIPIGLDIRTLQPALLKVQGPGGSLILGDSATGKSTVLTNIARCALAAAADVDVHAIASTWSPLLLLPRLARATTLSGIDKWAAEFFDSTDRPRLVLIDDADRLDGDVFERLASLGDPRTVLVVAGRTRDLELPGHWTAPLRRSRSAVIVRPLAGDGAMFGLHLRVTSSHPAIGRGVMIDDHKVIPILLAGPTDDTPIGGDRP